jgi:plasmid stabilization system protein ParE
MAQRKVSILDKAAEEVAHVAYFIESKGLPETAKKFVNEAFSFFQKLGDSRMKHKPCSFTAWREEGYRCANFRKKYVVAYLDTEKEIIICDFTLQKLLT